MPAPPGTQSVRRAVDLLLAFRDDDEEHTLTGLSESLRLNKTAVHRLLSVLEEAEFVVRSTDSGGYRLGPTMIVLGSRALHSTRLRGVARPELEGLARRSRESATLEVLVGNESLIVDEVAGPQVLSPVGEIGTRWPAHATSTGKVLLAWRTEEWPWGGRLKRLTPSTVASRSRLEEQLAGVRRKGYATAIEELEVGFSAVAAPVRDHEGSVVASVGIGGPSTRIKRGTIAGMAELVMTAAEGVSSKMGWKASE